MISPSGVTAERMRIGISRKRQAHFFLARVNEAHRPAARSAAAGGDGQCDVEFESEAAADGRTVTRTLRAGTPSKLRSRAAVQRPWSMFDMEAPVCSLRQRPRLEGDMVLATDAEAAVDDHGAVGQRRRRRHADQVVPGDMPRAPRREQNLVLRASRRTSGASGVSPLSCEHGRQRLDLDVDRCECAWPGSNVRRVARQRFSVVADQVAGESGWSGDPIPILRVHPQPVTNRAHAGHARGRETSRRTIRPKARGRAAPPHAAARQVSDRRMRVRPRSLSRASRRRKSVAAKDSAWAHPRSFCRDSEQRRFDDTFYPVQRRMCRSRGPRMSSRVESGYRSRMVHGHMPERCPHGKNLAHFLAIGSVRLNARRHPRRATGNICRALDTNVSSKRRARCHGK